MLETLQGSIRKTAEGKDLLLIMGSRHIFFDDAARPVPDISLIPALGADFILLGRAAMFGVVAGGEEGVVHALSLLQAECPTARDPKRGGAILLIGVVIIVGALTYFPALALGPIVEHLLLAAGQSL